MPQVCKDMRTFLEKLNSRPQDKKANGKACISRIIAIMGRQSHENRAASHEEGRQILA